MIRFAYFTGTVTAINDFTPQEGQPAGCHKLMTVQDASGSIVNFHVLPDTYFADHLMVRPGDTVTGFYDANAPAILIYPPQYRAIVVAEASSRQYVTVDYFDSQLVSSSGILKLNISPATRILLTNGQSFTADPANRYLIVSYGATTRSIPAQTTPSKIVVMCGL